MSVRQNICVGDTAGTLQLEDGKVIAGCQEYTYRIGSFLCFK